MHELRSDFVKISWCKISWEFLIILYILALKNMMNYLKKRMIKEMRIFWYEQSTYEMYAISFSCTCEHRNEKFNSKGLLKSKKSNSHCLLWHHVPFQRSVKKSKRLLAEERRKKMIYRKEQHKKIAHRRIKINMMMKCFLWKIQRTSRVDEILTESCSSNLFMKKMTME